MKTLKLPGLSKTNLCRARTVDNVIGILDGVVAGSVSLARHVDGLDVGLWDWLFGVKQKIVFRSLQVCVKLRC
jgi:hypothetical protein